MGSLMAGWDSPILDAKSVQLRKNRSFTKEEIEAYWRTKKKVEEEHLKAISSPSHGSTTENVVVIKEDGRTFQRSSTMPGASRQGGFMNQLETETTLEDLIKKNGWWTRSNWAFLNEPPVLESASNSYTSQFHIASLADSKANNSGISAN